MTLLMSGVASVYGQAMDAEVPGDNFSLEGALELFKKSSSPEDFERLLNSPDSKVNNLDLNGDGYVDYIRVLNRTEGNVHLFILQAVISEDEAQDIAVIELEKKADGKAVLQIIGDEDIYGVTTIIEPTQEVRTYAGSNVTPVVVNVWSWPAVRYVYSPFYTVWVSPWGWYSRPVWYSTWRPITYVHYHSVWYPYRSYYTVCHTRRIVHAHHIYHPHRTTSVIVHNRHHDKITHYRTAHRDDYRNGRTRTDRSRTYSDSGRPGNSEGRTYQNTNPRSTTPRDGSQTRPRQTQSDAKPNTNSDWSYTQRRSYDNKNSGRESTQRQPQVRQPQTSTNERKTTDASPSQNTGDNWRTTRPVEVRKPQEQRTYQQNTPRTERTAPTVNRTAPTVNRTAPTVNRTSPPVNRTAPAVNRSEPANRNINMSRQPEQQRQQNVRSAPPQNQPRSNSGSSGSRNSGNNGNNGRSRDANRGR